MARIGSPQTILSWANAAAMPTGIGANNGPTFEPTPHGGIIVDWAVGGSPNMSSAGLTWQASSDGGTTWFNVGRISSNALAASPMAITLAHADLTSTEFAVPFCLEGTDASPRASAPVCFEHMRAVLTLAGVAVGTTTSLTIQWCPVID